MHKTQPWYFRSKVLKTRYTLLKSRRIKKSQPFYHTHLYSSCTDHLPEPIPHEKTAKYLTITSQRQTSTAVSESNLWKVKGLTTFPLTVTDATLKLSAEYFTDKTVADHISVVFYWCYCNSVSSESFTNVCCFGTLPLTSRTVPSRDYHAPSCLLPV